MSKLKVSIIIPVYNVEAYLAECLDSVLNQTLEEIEVICVDDGSTDDSVNILEKYAQQDSRIKIIRQKNQFAGVARNNGLADAKGDFVIFLDADDFFAPNMLELAYKKALKCNSDIVIFGGKRYNDANKQMSDKREFLYANKLPQEEVFSHKDIPDTIFSITNPAPWNKLYRREFINSCGLKFQPFPNSNDFFFVMASLALADRICAVDDDLIFYRINNASSTQARKDRDPLRFFSAIYALYDMLEEKQLYEFVAKSFVHIALSSTEYNIRTVYSDTARLKILNEMESERYQKLDLFHVDDASYYNSYTTYGYARRLYAAIMQHQRIVSSQEEKTYSVDSVYRDEREVAVSVIIPVYNTELYVGETIKSIAKQTLRNLEIICIDDGSTDSSLQIVKEWAERDKRISVICEPNSGQSQARNTALTIARGEYIYFMDSDDILDSEALKILYENAQTENADIVYFDADTFYDSDELEKTYAKFRNAYTRVGDYSELCTGACMFTKFQTNREWSPSPCLQLIKSELIKKHNLRFRVGTIHEDNAFSFAAIMSADRVMHLSRVFFHRRVREKSTMTTQTGFQNAYGYFCGFMDMYRVFIENQYRMSPEIYAAASERLCTILRSAQNCYRQMPEADKGSEYGLGYEYKSFSSLVIQPANWKKAADEIGAIRAKLNQANRENAKLAEEKRIISVQYKETMDSQSNRIDELERKVVEYQNSFSFKVGWILTYIPRKTVGWVKRVFLKKAD